LVLDAAEELRDESQDVKSGATIHLTEEEMNKDVKELDFEQIYRKILRQLEDGVKSPIEWLMEMVRKVKTEQEYGHLLIIARIYQNRLQFMTPPQCSEFMKRLIRRGFEDEILKCLSEGSPRLFPQMGGYEYLIWKYLSNPNLFPYSRSQPYRYRIQQIQNMGGIEKFKEYKKEDVTKYYRFDQVWHILQILARRGIKPNSTMFNMLSMAYVEKKDHAGVMKTLKAQRNVGLRLSGSIVTQLIIILHSQGLHQEIIELYKLTEEDKLQQTGIRYLFFIRAFLAAGDEAGAVELIKKAPIQLIGRGLHHMAYFGRKDEGMKEWLSKIREKVNSIYPPVSPTEKVVEKKEPRPDGKKIKQKAKPRRKSKWRQKQDQIIAEKKKTNINEKNTNKGEEDKKVEATA